MATMPTADCLTLRVAGLELHARSLDPAIRLGARGATARFLVPTGEEAGGEGTHVLVAGADLGAADAPAPPARLLFDSGQVWRLFRREGGYGFQFTAAHRGGAPYKCAVFDERFARGEVRLHRPYLEPGAAVNPLEYPLDELLLIHLLAAGRGAEIHACGLVDETGQGRLFVGQSGAGKSTTARLWRHARPGARILSDDRIILRREGFSTVWMYGTPWHGEEGLALPERAPLAGIYFLAQARENRLLPLSRSEAVARLVACSFLPFHDAAGLAFTLAFLDDVTERVPAAELRFRRDAGAVEALDD